jgi:hypothetical protein
VNLYKRFTVYILTFTKLLYKKVSPLPCLTPPQVRLIPGALSDLFAQVTCSGKITLADRYGLMAAVLEEELSEQERASIDRLLHALRRGRLKVVPDISTR